MTLFDSYTRDQLRLSYADAWRKNLAHAPLTTLEAMIADVISVHPEYQAAVVNPEVLAAIPGSLGNTENPFLHMGLHMAVREQVSIDRPPGIRALHRQLQARHGDVHGAEHVLMEALGETLWQAQRAGRPPDEGEYLALARRGLGGTNRR